AARRCRSSSARGRRRSTTSRCRSRSCGRGRSRGRPSTRTSSGGSGCATTRKRSHAALEAWRERFVAGAGKKGVEEPQAHELYDKLVAFSGFGFPKSHAAAFGLLAYQSAWLRHHYAAEFLAALLNAQPMGFYPPATLVRDGQRRGVETRPPHVNRSEVGCTIEEDGAVRVGLKYVTGVGEGDAEAVAASRPYSSIRELAQRTGLS